MARNCIEFAGSLVTLIFFSYFVCMCCPTRDVGHVLNLSLHLAASEAVESSLHRSIMFPMTTSRDQFFGLVWPMGILQGQSEAKMVGAQTSAPAMWL